MSIPTVSICMLTYNHADFIAKALESIIFQQTKFNVELILCNDASTDITDKVVSKSIEKFKLYNSKLKIHYFNQTKNLGILKSFVFSLEKCKGQYIAICEGDDYWTDPLKLQKQVDFMETNPEFAGTGTQCQVIYENSSKAPHMFSNIIKEVLTIDDFLGTRPFHTATFLFRSKYIKKGFPINILSADRMLYMLVASFGKIKFLPDVTAVYRKNQGGISRNVTSRQLKKDYNIITFIQNYTENFNVNKLRAFIGYTVLAYSHKIYFLDFIKASFYYFFFGYLSDRNTRVKNNLQRLKKRLQLIKRSLAKIKWI